MEGGNAALLSDDDLQKAFRLISYLHPNRAVALCVLMDACDHISVIRKLQERRSGSSNSFKVKVPESSLLQLAVYLASELWERDQESKHPRKQPVYRPTREDLLTRYVKTLVWKSMDRPSRYAAVGLGCLLYTYQPHEVSSLAEELFDSDNIRRVKGWMVEQIKSRFQGANSLTGGNGHVELDAPSNRQRALIQMSLSEFAPWCSSCDAATTWSTSISLLETYFDKDSNKSEWERVHVLFDPACGGLARLVHEYNSTYSRGNNMRLDDPDNKLGSPRFGDDFQDPTGDGGEPPDPEDRFNPTPLTPDEMAYIKHSFERNQRRRKNYRSNRLRVYVDGEEAEVFSHDYFVEPFLVPQTASCIEVFGEDEEGELLLAVFPLSYFEPSDNVPEQNLSVIHDGGQTLELTISNLPEQNLESPKSLVRLEYSETSGNTDDELLEASNLYWYATKAVNSLNASIDEDVAGIEKLDADAQHDDSHEAGLIPHAPHPRPVFFVGHGGLGGAMAERYRLLRQLGSGGMGVVYLAQDQRLSLPVNIKVLHWELMEKERSVRESFISEMERLSRVEHPGVTKALDFGELADGRHYIVTPHFPGVSLREEISPQGMVLERAVGLCCQMAQALGAVHEQGIVHRDIKPENILLHKVDGKEQVKVLDFGMARLFDGYTSAQKHTRYDPYYYGHYDGAYRHSERWLMNIKAAELTGALGYRSPEQLMGKVAGAATDIYALGVMLYEMLTGRVPFLPDTPHRLLESQRRGLKASLYNMRPNLPRAALAAIAKAMAFNPQDRYGSILEFGADLSGAITGETGVASTELLQRAYLLSMALADYPGRLYSNCRRHLGELCLIVLKSEEFRQTRPGEKMIFQNTANELLLTFFRDNPSAAVRLAVEIALAAERQLDLKLRMGLHTGPVYTSGEGMPIVVGDSIYIAQMLMKYSDTGRILLSSDVADELRLHSEWSTRLHECGKLTDQHGHRLRIFTLYTGESGYP